VLKRAGCNIEISQMTIVGGNFATVLIASADSDADRELEAALQEACAPWEMWVHVQPLDPGRFRPFRGPEPSHTITVRTGDRPGVVHAVVEALAAKGVNITELSSGGASGESSPVCVVMLNLALPARMGEEDLEATLTPLRQQMDIEIEQLPRRA
jgi:glycine cleavage system regulatory protein